jgi:hypothetical protein
MQLSLLFLYFVRKWVPAFSGDEGQTALLTFSHKGIFS